MAYEQIFKGYVGFDKLKGELAHRPGVTNPGALAAYIGRKKYGKKKFDRDAAKHKKMDHEEPVRKAIGNVKRFSFDD